jgi:PilZ domain
VPEIKSKPSETAPVTGLYKVCHDSARSPSEQHRPPHLVVILQGDVFPSCIKCGNAVSFVLRREEIHLLQDWDFAGPPELLIRNRPDRRLFPRSGIEIPIRLMKPKPLTGRSHDLSEGGLGATVEADLKNDEFVGMEFKLPRSRKPINIASRVRHRTGMRYGFQFARQTRAQRAQIRRFCATQTIP